MHKLSLVLSSLALLSALPVLGAQARPAPSFEIEERKIVQPLDHGNPAGETFVQRLLIAKSKAFNEQSPVFFLVGGELSITEAYLRKLAGTYSDPSKPMIFVLLEHRGFGESTSSNEDQTVPSYVGVDQYLGDIHEVVRAFRSEFRGKWVAAGWSYGGTLVIEAGNRYPSDFDALLSVSGTTRWPYFQKTFDRRTRELLGKSLNKELAGQISRLQPDHLYDEKWKQREFVTALTKGILYRKNINWLKSILKLAGWLPSNKFLGVLHWLDDRFASGQAWNYALSTSASRVSKAEIATGKFDWRVFRYQQCTQLGYFDLPGAKPTLYQRTEHDYLEECRALFGNLPDNFPKEWNVEEEIPALRAPLFYVKGANDPFAGQQLPDTYSIPRGKLYFSKRGFHNPDLSDPELAHRILDDVWKVIGTKPPK